MISATEGLANWAVLSVRFLLLSLVHDGRVLTVTWPQPAPSFVYLIYSTTAIKPHMFSSNFFKSNL